MHNFQMGTNTDSRNAYPRSTPFDIAVLPGADIRFEHAPDGSRLRVGSWPPAKEPNGFQLLLTQGRTEFLEKYAETIAELTGRGFSVWAMDWRGQGLSQRLLDNPHKGHIDDFETYLSDLEWFDRRFVRPAAKAQNLRTVVLGHSMGGHLAFRALLEGRLGGDGRDAIAPACMVLSAPMIDLPLDGVARTATDLLVAGATAIGLSSAYCPGMSDYDPARLRFENNPLTGDRDRYDRIGAAVTAVPGVALGGVTYGWTGAAMASIRQLARLTERAAATPCPVLICVGMQDRVVSIPAQQGLARLPGCTVEEFAGARHEILMETDAIRTRFWTLFDEFVGPVQG